MQIVGVIDEDPFDPATWSGSSVHFFNAFRDRGELTAAVSALPSRVVRRIYQALSFQPDRRRWRFRYNLNLGYYRAMTRVARRKVAAIAPDEFDVILQVGAWYDLTGPHGKPVVSYHDGNLSTLLASPFGHPPIARRHIEATLRYERELYRRIRLMFPMSEWLAGSFVRDDGVDARKLHPVGAGVNLTHVRRIENKSYEAPRFLFVGVELDRKGGTYLLEAFERVRAEVPDAELTLVGPVMTSPPPGVRCLGYISKRDPHGLERLLDEYERASVFVLPSLYEPFGIAFAEAMAHRLPCIGTSICAMPEIIGDGVTGFVVPPRDTAALADRMLELLRSPGTARDFGDSGFAKYADRFTWAAVTRRISEIVSAELRG